MPNLQYPAYTPNIYKKDRVYRQSNGYFMHVRCNDCEEQTVCYSHSQTDIRCKGCSGLILKSSGGKAIIVNKARSKIADNNY